MIKHIDKRKKKLPPFQRRGGCVPYAIAAICNDERIVDMYPAKDEDGQPISHGFYHASMMMAQSKERFCFFNVLLAVSRYYDAKGDLKCPKTITLKQFSQCATIMHLAKNWKDKDASCFILLLEVYQRRAVHAIGVVFNILDGSVSVVDRQKEHIINMDIGWVFSNYRVLKVAILHGSHNGVSVVLNNSMDHLSVSLDGQVSDF